MEPKIDDIPLQNQSPTKVSPEIQTKNQLLDLSNKLKNYNPSQYFTIGSFIDALDNNKSWRVAKIIEINDEIATLSFDGWSNKWNEMHKITSNKLAPFRKNTPPYTGPSKNPTRNTEFVQIIAQIKNAKHHMEQFISINLLAEPNLINQFIRGELVILIDSILCYPNSINPEQIKIILDFLEGFIAFAIKYLSVMPLYLKDYIDGRLINQDLFLVHEKIAVCTAFPEIFFTLIWIFGGEPRCQKFYSQNEFQITPSTNPFVTKPKDRFSSTHNQIINFVNLFGSLGGFEKILDLMKWELMEKKKQTECPDNDTIYKIPLIIVKYFLMMLDNILGNMTSSFKEKFLLEFKNAFFKRINSINVKEIKDIEPNTVYSLLSKIQTILDEICIKDTYMLTEEAELNFSLKLLKSPYLQKKIKGMTHLKDIIERLEPTYEKLETKKRLKFYTQEKLRAYFISNKILEFILGENFHIEVFKRSVPFLKFLASSGGLTNEQLDSLWTAVESKHEGYTASINELLIDLLKKLPLESLEYLFGKLIVIPQEKCDESTIDLMREFSEISMASLNSTNGNYYSAKPKKLNNPKYEFFALRYLWDLVQDNSKLDNKYVNACLNSLYALLKSSFFKSEKENYLNLCFENIKKGVSVPQSLNISLRIIASYNAYTMFYSKELSLEQILSKYCKDYNLIELLISNFEAYLSQVSIIESKNKKNGVKIENYSNYIFCGKYNHNEQIEIRLNFLQTIDPHVEKKLQLTIDHIKRLWIILIKKAVTPLESTLFLAWLTKQKETTTLKKVYCFSDSFLKAIFINLISDKVLMDDYVNINLDIYNCIQSLFDIVNSNEELIEIISKSGNRKVSKYENLYGLDYFWNILIKTNETEVKKKLH